MICQLSKVTLCLKVKESCIVYIYIYIFVWLFFFKEILTQLYDTKNSNLIQMYGFKYSYIILIISAESVLSNFFFLMIIIRLYTVIWSPAMDK